jgi:pantoate--beta-alanine ligase
MSSRNTYLNPAERAQAPIIFQALRQAVELVKNGQLNAAVVRRKIRAKIRSAPLAEIEYIEIVREQDLTPVEFIEPGTFVAVAVRFGKTRLIDNIVLRSAE